MLQKLVGNVICFFFLGPAAHTFREYPEFELGGALSVGVRGMSASDQVFKEVLQKVVGGRIKSLYRSLPQYLYSLTL